VGKFVDPAAGNQPKAMHQADMPITVFGRQLGRETSRTLHQPPNLFIDRSMRNRHIQTCQNRTQPFLNLCHL